MAGGSSKGEAFSLRPPGLVYTVSVGPAPKLDLTAFAPSSGPLDSRHRPKTATMQSCSFGLALLAASLSAASGLGLGVARRASEPDSLSGDSDPSKLDSVSAELDLSAERVSLLGLAFAFPAAPLGWG